MKTILNFWLKPQIWSNFIFLLPIGVAIKYGYTFEAMLLVFTMLVSMSYHSFSDEVNIEWFFLRKNVSKPEFVAGILDYISGLSVVILFAWEFFDNNPNNLSIIALIILSIIGFVIFMGPNYFKFLNRWSVTKSHSAWHIISGLIATLTLM